VYLGLTTPDLVRARAPMMVFAASIMATKNFIVEKRDLQEIPILHCFLEHRTHVSTTCITIMRASSSGFCRASAGG
jgi:hypothetical protein